MSQADNEGDSVLLTSDELWAALIGHAEKLLAESKARTYQLKTSIKTFKDLRDSGMKCPGSSDYLREMQK